MHHETRVLQKDKQRLVFFLFDFTGREIAARSD
jgi:hypothetical protein